MEELIRKVTDATGVTGEQARKAIEVVRDEMKNKFPSPLHSEIDNVINGGKFGATYREKAEEIRAKVEEAARHAGAKAESVIAELREKLNEFFNTSKNNSDQGKK